MGSTCSRTPPKPVSVDTSSTHGIVKYDTSDRYEGQLRYGKPEGFGVWHWKDGSKSTGFFAGGLFHGYHTYEDGYMISRGYWIVGGRHGKFIRTRKNAKITYEEYWVDDHLQSTKKITYVPPEELQTVRKKKDMKKKVPFVGKFKQCNICCVAPTDCTNDLCGHIIACHDCYSACSSCPICRSPIGKIIRLYVA